MRDAQPRAIYLRDYQPPAFLIERTELAFDLHEDHALVTACLHLRRNAGAGKQALELHGQELELVSIGIDDRPLAAEEYELSDAGLRIADVPDSFRLQSQCRILPQNNTSLEGLYKSRTLFCTQCEAEGFRKITWYLDRPDVMAEFEVTVEADAARYPVLLSNGNPLAYETLENGRHRARWHDPFPKPAYLFALVAGDLRSVDDTFVTASGREVALHIHVEEKDLDKCGHAMRSLKQAMRWDEEVYGREYDLDVFNIVAVDDFNGGAMENKGLNIFNSSCVLCSPEITTDAEFQNVQAIVAHEYFHNWSGNRVTCRDWFQLSLKEGFTVFRDAEFSADMGSPTVKRVADVNVLRNAQFAEDAGPLAHPVRPESFIEISNFYTVTIYEKGAEVVRMIHTLLGEERFRAGSDLYFQRHDGQAVTCEDFVRAMEEASGVDLQQFRRWYSQAGTPLVSAEGRYDADAQRFFLTLRQSCPATPGQAVKEPLVIPVALGLLGSKGNLPLCLDTDDDVSTATHRVLVLSEPEQTFVFEHVTEAPVPALLRGFSAPVRLACDYTSAQLRALMSREDDGFLRWDAAQQYALRVINEIQAQQAAGEEGVLDPEYLAACGDLLRDTELDPALVAEMLSLPGENYLADLAAANGGADVDAIHAARKAVRSGIATTHRDALQACYLRLENSAPYAPDAAQIGARRLRNVCLDYLALAGADGLLLAEAQFAGASNMSDRLAALQALAFHGDATRRDPALQKFHADWQHETLVMNKWLQLQATIPAPGTLEQVQQLLQHPVFDVRNPNKVRALIGAFANANPLVFHRADGAGYRLLADMVMQIDSLNPQLAARLLVPLTRWRNYRGRGEQMRGILQGMIDTPTVSRDVYEMLERALAD
ncbi:aminopeptidase N [Haliea salexigens]|uniref:aminopeptidase N n=1 Tax=Haliea salexigens TaxID=287487 RepID=UPI000415D6AF|nr:aminopeptidase N [Haliea salexigens]|tara:strand:+ start:5560 stop:8208 length:2649 start_codon:yes stop_codon:yes gene_type:complete